MIKLKDVVWGEVELVEEDDTNAGGGSVSVMTCCGWPPPDEGQPCWYKIGPVAPYKCDVHHSSTY